MTEIDPFTHKIGVNVPITVICQSKLIHLPIFLWVNESISVIFQSFLSYIRTQVPLHAGTINNRTNRRRLIEHRAFYDQVKLDDQGNRQSSAANRALPIARSRLAITLRISLPSSEETSFLTTFYGLLFPLQRTLYGMPI